MPLKIRLRPKEKVVVNGAVITAEEAGGTTLVLHNKASILRQRDIMQAEDATSPAKRIYFQIMLMYIDPEGRDDYLDDYMRFMTDLLTATNIGEIRRTLLLIYRDVQDGNLYRALKTCKALTKAEQALMEAQQTEGADALAQAKATADTASASAR